MFRVSHRYSIPRREFANPSLLGYNQLHRFLLFDTKIKTLNFMFFENIYKLQNFNKYKTLQKITIKKIYHFMLYQFLFVIVVKVI